MHSAMVPRGTGVPRVGHTEFVPVLALTQARELTRELYTCRIMFRGGWQLKTLTSAVFMKKKIIKKNASK